ncbi:MAG: diacylglycerol kinase family protein [Actinomycetaceae bacterium]|nr:diacylglycerol kinase family protein [Actinomycetaceae bacterium]MDY6082346.1 diacylglycerol kinase family protein [Actinomycetaceae bacterium]
MTPEILSVAACVCAAISLIFVIILLLRTGRSGNDEASQLQRTSVSSSASLAEESDAHSGASGQPEVAEESAVSRDYTARPELPAIVFNPTKVENLPALKAMAREAAAFAGFREPLWIETSEDDPGVSQTRVALEHGAGVVIAAGGDGTVRSVAGALAGSGVPLGILPLGTGNLLARNIGIPLGRPLDALAVALTGSIRHIDVGYVASAQRRLPPIEVADHDGRGRAGADRHNAGGAEAGSALEAFEPVFEGEEPFVVIAGTGFDASIMNDTDSDLKSSVGWMAYVAAGAKNLAQHKIHARITTAGTESLANPRFRDGIHVSARSIMFANCGALIGGVTLAPDAQIDDGWLDVTFLNPARGILGWADLANKIGLQSIGIRAGVRSARAGVKSAASSVQFRRARALHLEMAGQELVEVDGDVLGRAQALDVSLKPGALAVRVP